MASGRGTKLVGAIGEFLVAAQLNRIGLMATPFSGNVPHYDIIASSKEGGHLPIQVKTVRKSSWQFNVSTFVEISMDGDKQIIGNRLPSPYRNLFCVFVALGETYKTDRYFVFSWDTLTDIVIQHHSAYLASHGGIRPRNPQSLHCSISLARIEAFENDWKSLWQAIPNTFPAGSASRSLAHTPRADQ